MLLVTDDDLNPTTCRRPWAAVALATIEDARRGRDAGYLRTEDFATVVSLAGLDADAVRETLMRRAGCNARTSTAA